MDFDPRDITLAILAGGEGSRMGKPKGLLEVRGRPILAYLLDQFRWPGPTLLVTAPGRERPPGWEMFTREATDPVSGEGPLRGVRTALSSTETDVTLLTTVDMPEVGSEQLSWLGKALDERRDAAGIMLRRPGEPPRIEPFPSIFRRHAAHVIGSRLAMGLLSVQSLANATEFVLMSAPTEWSKKTWTNLNRPDDLRRWLS